MVSSSYAHQRGHCFVGDILRMNQLHFLLAKPLIVSGSYVGALNLDCRSTSLLIMSFKHVLVPIVKMTLAYLTWIPITLYTFSFLSSQFGGLIYSNSPPQVQLWVTHLNLGLNSSGSTRNKV